MPTLLEDLETQSNWIVAAFHADQLQLDYTIRSFIEIDRFISTHSRNGKPIKGGRLSSNMGTILFSLGAYVGETFRKAIPGSKWVIDKDDPEAEINAAIEFPDGSTVWPIQRVMKRFQNGPEDSVYIYGFGLTNETISQPFEQSYWAMQQESGLTAKPWWKFWK